MLDHGCRMHLVLISIIFGLINYFSIKNVKFIEKAIDQEPENILKTYKDILKLKPMKFFIPWVFFYLFGSAMVSANTNYLLIYSAGVDPGGSGRYCRYDTAAISFFHRSLR